MYEFCPDTIDQGYVGPLPGEGAHWEDFDEAFENQSAKDLAEYLRRNKYIFLWWD